MRHLTTAAMALALAASAAAVSADPQDNNKDHGHAASGQPPQHGGGPPPGGGQPHGGPPPGAPRTFTPAPVHAGGPGGVQNFDGQAVGGNAFHGNGQSGGAGGQNYRGYGRGPGGYVAPAAPTGQATTGGQSGHQFHGGNGAPNAAAGGNPFHAGGPQGGQGGAQFHGGNGAPNAAAGGNQFHAGGPQGGQGGAQFHGGNQFHGNPAVNAAIRGGTPGSDHDLRGRDSGRGWYNASRFPQQFHAERRFHADWNNRPHGWYQRTWRFGEFLPFGWFEPDYYLDFQDYGLAYPPVGCEWVRQGPDAVLVNVWTGEVLSVAYGVFW